MRNQTILVDINKETCKILKYKQYDNNNILQIIVEENYKKINLNKYVGFALFELPSGFVIEKECKIEDNVITIIIDNNILSEDGKVLLDLTLSNGEDIFTLFRINLVVEETINRAEAIIMEAGWDIITEISKFDKAEEQRETNEERRVDYENVRIANESDRQNEEMKRIANEKVRDVKESERLINEELRRTEEKERLTDEQARVKAENTRIANENERLRKEVERQNAEELRQIAYNSSLYGRMDEAEEQLAHSNQVFINVLNPPDSLEKPKYDGVTNDTEAIQNIINYVHENYNGGTVYLPSGDIKIFPTGEGVGDKTNPKRWGCLVLYDNIKIVGSGWGTRIIGDNTVIGNRYNEGTRAKGVFSFSHNITGDNIPTINCKISNLWIDGGNNGIMAGNVSNSTFSHLKITNQSVDGIYHGFPGAGSSCNPSNNVIEHCLFDGCDRQGISFLKGDNIVVRDCVIQNIKGEIGGPGASIDIEPEDVGYCKNILIENVRSTNCVIGLLVYGNQRNVHNITIRNCIIEGATSSDLSVEFADNITIDNCKIIKGNHEDDEIRFYKVNKLTMTNCTIDGCGIQFIVSNSEISNNIIKNSPTFGIQLNYVYNQFSSIYNNVTGNKIIDTYGVPIYVYNATWSNITNNFILNANGSNSTKDEASYMYFANLRYCNVNGNIMRSTNDVLPVNGVYCPNATYNYYNILSNNVISNVSGKHIKLYWANSSSVNNIEVPAE